MFQKNLLTTKITTCYIFNTSVMKIRKKSLPFLASTTPAKPDIVITPTLGRNSGGGFFR